MNLNLLDNYKKFCDIRENSINTKKIDLSNETFLYPTTLLPLINYQKGNKLDCIKPKSDKTKDYFDIMNNLQTNSKQKTSIPFTELPKDSIEGNKKIAEMFELLGDGKNVGGENAFKYMVNEMVTNIYEHSKFNNAYTMAQKYPNKQFLEVCFYDDGIGIPGSFKKAKIEFDSDKETIMKAVEGTSTKETTSTESPKRGYGLSRNLKLIKDKFNGEMLIVSNSGAFHLHEQKQYKYDLSKKYILAGTLVSYRYKFPVMDVNIYDGSIE